MSEAGTGKALGAMLLALCAVGAFAREPAAVPSQWTKVSATSAGGCTFYIDQSTMATRGAYKEARFLSSCDRLRPSSVAGKPGFMSTAFLEYFDCAAKKTAIVELKYYAGEFASGKVTESHDWSKPPKFEEDPPNSNAAIWLAMVCRGMISPPEKMK